MQLISTYHGKYGVIRDYHHQRLGPIQIATVWKDPGAHIVHVMHWRKGEQPATKPKRRKRAAAEPTKRRQA